jgi:para-aminobenzoate synthetase
MTGSPDDVVEEFARVAATKDRCFWLDGGGSRQWSGRRSLIGWLDPDDVSLSYDAARREVTRHAEGRSEVVGDAIFDVLEDQMAGDDASVHWVGYFGYACRPDLPARPADGVPDAVWMRARNVRFHQHGATVAEVAETASGVVSTSSTTGDGSTTVPDWYAEAFLRVQEELHAGNSYEVNLTYRLAIESGLDPVTAYVRLRERNPAPYAGFLRHRGTHLLSSSPERFATIDRHRWVETRPMKGTTARGASPEEDERLRLHLASDPKFRAENLMIVDLLRNDLSMVCETGTVTVPDLMKVESYASVHQLVSTVRGHLRDDVTTVGALRAMFPAGSMTGAPKLRTMQIIDAVETTPRGVYAGAFGWISGDGRADLGVVIRSLVEHDGQWELGTGGAITVRSDLTEEYAETRWKSTHVIAALDGEDSGH